MENWKNKKIGKYTESIFKTNKTRVKLNKIETHCKSIPPPSKSVRVFFRSHPVAKYRGYSCWFHTSMLLVKIVLEQYAVRSFSASENPYCERVKDGDTQS